MGGRTHDGDDEDGFLESSSTSRTEDERLENLLVHGGTERSETAVSNLREKMHRSGFVSDWRRGRRMVSLGGER